MTTTFRYNKEMIYAEFEQAKQKDISLSTKKTLDEKTNDIFTNPKTLKKESVDVSRLIRVFVNNIVGQRKSIK